MRRGSLCETDMVTSLIPLCAVVHAVSISSITTLRNEPATGRNRVEGFAPITMLVPLLEVRSVNAIALSVLVKVIVVSLCWRAFVSRGELVERNVYRDRRRVEVG